MDVEGSFLQRFIKVAGLTGIIFAIVQTALLSQRFGITNASIQGAIGGIVFGVLMASIMLLTNRRIKGTNQAGSSTYHERIISLSGSTDEVLDLCKKALSSLNRKYSIKLCDKENGILQVKLGMTMKSWGDIVEFKLEKTDTDKMYNVCVSSRPWVRTTMVDWGSNLDNVEKIGAFLGKYGTQPE